MNTNEIKKGMKIKSVQLGFPVTGIMMDNKKGNTRLIETNGSEIGMFDSMGSVYAYDITLVEVNGQWERVEHTDAQLKLKNVVGGLF